MHTKLSRFCVALIVAVVLALGLRALPVTAGTDDFTITAFSADYYLSRDVQKISHLHVEETIVAEFPRFDQNHGILRAIPRTYKGHPLYLDVKSVTRSDGTAWPYNISTQNDNSVLQIGDAAAYVQGTQTFRIAYNLKYVTTNFVTHDEWFWDVNGDQWKQPFGSVEARLHIPAELRGSLHQESKCYAGKNGSTQQACIISRIDQTHETVLTIRSSRPLQPAETLTFVVGFAKDTFAPYQKPRGEVIALLAKIGFGGILPPLIALGVVLRKWRRDGRDARTKGTIVPQYLPPKEVSVMGSNAVLREKFQPLAVSAQIVDLAVRHYIIIYEISIPKKFRKDEIAYEIGLARLPEGLRHEEKAVIDLLFGKKAHIGAKVKVKDLRNKLHQKAGIIGNSVNRRLVGEGYFRQEPEAAKKPYIIVGCILLAVGCIGIPFLVVGVIIAGVIVLVASNFMPARTLKGVQLRDYLLGMQMYMQVAEAERLKILQSPRGDLTVKIDVSDTHKLVKIYEKLLPYAMLMGIEKEWAAQFATLYDAPPDWYHGSGTSFNPVYFATAMHSFGGLTTESFTSPTDANGSGFSGGSAGGGGGGGGGGGW